MELQVESKEVDDSQEVEDSHVEDQRVVDTPVAKYNVAELVFLKIQSWEGSKVFWESLAIVKSRRYDDSQWLYHQMTWTMKSLRLQGSPRKKNQGQKLLNEVERGELERRGQQKESSETDCEIREQKN